MSQRNDATFMNECLTLAAKGQGYVSPNPLVGAVLVKNNRIVARGWHRRFGGPHAEVECLRSYKGDVRGTTLYVNLEPCSHHGKTPPCADLLVARGIRKVVVGMNDPNPLVSGSGIRKLRQAGVKVISGVLRREAAAMNRMFTTFITEHRPFMHVKIAQSLDGKIALPDGSPLQLTGLDSQKLVHKWRREHDAVLVGVGTIHTDDPALTVRLIKGRNPAVVIIDGKFSIKPDARVLRTAGYRKVIIFVNDQETMRQKKKLKKLESRGAIIVPCGRRNDTFSVKRIMNRLFELNIGSVLVEGGSAVFSQFLRSNVVDSLSIFIAPLILGSGVPAVGQVKGSSFKIQGHPASVCSVGNDVLVQYSFLQKG